MTTHYNERSTFFWHIVNLKHTRNDGSAPLGYAQISCHHKGPLCHVRGGGGGGRWVGGLVGGIVSRCVLPVLTLVATTKAFNWRGGCLGEAFDVAFLVTLADVMHMLSYMLPW